MNHDEMKDTLVYVNYTLTGQIPVIVKNDFSSTEQLKNQIYELIDNGDISDQELIDAIQKCGPLGIDGDAIQITGIFDEAYRQLWVQNEKENT